MSEDYTYGVFISYRHRGHTAEWIKNHFYPMLEQRLPECMPVDHDTKIFLDLKIETGSAWPDELRHALKMSRCILAVWSPDYFRSEWCLAEWHTL